MNICDICNEPLHERISTYEQPYHYTESGLPNVLISGVEVYSCPKCGVEVADIPRMDELHLMLAKELLLQPAAMTGQEFRFLRKEARLKPKEFAERIGVDPKTVVNWESAKYLSRQNDLTIRFLISTLLLHGKELEIVMSRLLDLTESSWSKSEGRTETLANWRETARQIKALAKENTSYGISAFWDFGTVEV